MVKELDERVTALEDKLAEFGPGFIDNEDCGEFDGLGALTREQKITIRMMLNNTTIGWKTAMRRIMSIVYGQEILAGSCAVGRKNATYSPLDKTKLDVVKGMSTCNII